ncbi:helix-turn-helix domain-containing protein [Paenibacillus alvei]|uniref:Helix-turn-helix domain-containing protein n=1 Tax=Paenibacillus alvei TaxID=44250 RepID=A0ABT4GY17_PAEAL|nr:helix-turn-helix domain-containing protein [Paenibacillus alvei]MCY9761612.1 helix-turn-helix domain-containing protein [Paenibacillus alvei]MCY9767373.1 helix-turn-helix domain-containing protein [Paenibacillus alvei]
MKTPTNYLPLVLTIKDAAEYFQRSTKTIRRRIKSGELRSYKEGQEHRIRREWLLDYERQLIEKGETA